MKLELILPLIGVALGWGLKAASDHWITRRQETQAFRKATFSLLKAFKAFMDYDRGTTYFRRDRPTPEVYEPNRAMLQTQILRETEANASSTFSAIEVLAAEDPTLAIRLHNSLRKIISTFGRDVGGILKQDPPTYASMIGTQDQLILMTLEDLEVAVLRLARSAGNSERRKVQDWIDEREKGEADYIKGMDEQAEIRNRAWSLARNSSEPENSASPLATGEN